MGGIGAGQSLVGGQFTSFQAKKAIKKAREDQGEIAGFNRAIFKRKHEQLARDFGNATGQLSTSTDLLEGRVPAVGAAQGVDTSEGTPVDNLSSITHTAQHAMRNIILEAEFAKKRLEIEEETVQMGEKTATASLRAAKMMNWANIFVGGAGTASGLAQSIQEGQARQGPADEPAAGFDGALNAQEPLLGGVDGRGSISAETAFAGGFGANSSTTSSLVGDAVIPSASVRGV